MRPKTWNETSFRHCHGLPKQVFTLFFCFQLMTCSLLAQKIENAQFKSIRVLTLTCISEIDIFTSGFEPKYLLFFQSYSSVSHASTFTKGY